MFLRSLKVQKFSLKIYVKTVGTTVYFSKRPLALESIKTQVSLSSLIKNKIPSSKINNMLSRGINPDKKSWDLISKIAFRTFVPESEESRAKGAGGGDAND